ncbi:hypothetical protein BJ741DRAFT_579114 [Chytriomyces cf. hyalinus JEL632]|nr:hypothetical protein BJ741DRAFT_579114 [Chytriomyces cf. hyalinus JEL632]
MHVQPILGGFPVSNQQHPNPRIWWAPISQSGQSVLDQAIALGVDADGSPLYACRMVCEGGMQVGKLRRDSTERLLRVDGRLVPVFVATIAPIETERESNGDPLFVAVTADRGIDKDGGALYAARIQMEGSLQVGKARNTGGALLDMRAKKFISNMALKCLTWARQDGAFSHTRLEGLVPIEAGHESDGTTLYIGVHRGCDGEQVGKCSARLHDGVHGLFGSEIVAADYFAAACRSSC